MGNKKKLLVIILIFVLLIGGASVLYQQLGQTIAMDRLAVQEPQQSEQTVEEPAEQPTEQSEATTADPVEQPSEQPSEQPAEQPSEQPSEQPAEQPAEEPKRKVAAPDFIVYDERGNEVYLSEYFGKPIVLNFWASWCGPCQMEMPAFHEKYLEFEDEVQFLMINRTDGRRETMKSAVSFLEKKGYTFPVLYDAKHYAAVAYGAFSIPTTFFIDADGYVAAGISGVINAEILQQGIDMIY